MNESHQPDLMNLARQARRRVGLLARHLFDYQEKKQLTDAQLAEAVGIPPEQDARELIARLALCELPLTDGQVRQVADYISLNYEQFTHWLKVAAWPTYRRERDERFTWHPSGIVWDDPGTQKQWEAMQAEEKE